MTNGPTPAEQATTVTAVGALPGPTTLDTAIRVAQNMLTAYSDSSSDSFAYPEAYGALRESVRILLHALGAEPAITSGDAEATRCKSAHPDDPTPCDGPVAVTVLDAGNAGADGCEHHAARLLASLEGGRVYGLPHAEAGTAIRVFKAADTLRPFPWIEDTPRTRPEQLSRAENRSRGEGR